MTQKRSSNVLALKLPKPSHGFSNFGTRREDLSGLSAETDAFKEMADNALQGIVVHRDLEPLYINRAWAALFGLTVDEVMALPNIIGLFHEADMERLRRYSIDRMAGRDAPHRYRYRINHSSGRTIWVEVFARLINWHGIPAFQSTVLDVDDQEKQAALLRQRQASTEAEVVEWTNALDQSKRQLQLYEACINQMSERITVIGTDYRIKMANQAQLDFRQRSLDQAIGCHVCEFVGDAWFNINAKAMMGRCFAGKTERGERLTKGPSGRQHHIEFTSEPFREKDGTITAAIVSVRDVTDTKQAKRQLRLLASVIEQVSDRISVIGSDYRYRLTNRANLDYHQKPLEAFLGVHIADVLGEQDFLQHSKPELDRCFAGETVRIQRSGRDGAGRHRILDIQAEPYREAEGMISGAIVTLRDVTEAQRLTERLAYQASHDELTGLLNRRAFAEQLKSAIRGTADSSRSAAFCFIDLDQFKIINDTVGHLVGDRLLKRVARLLRTKIRDGDVLARLGGDEFGLLLRGCSLRRAQRAAENLIAALNDYRFFHEGHVFEVSASIGITVINRFTPDISEIMSQADLACYAAKDHGRNRVHIYKKRDAFLRRRREEMHQARGIRAALDQDQFTLFAQPIKATSEAGSRRDRIEILLRMTGKADELIMPSSFIPAAERYGFMGEIDRWVIKETIAHLARPWPAPAGLQVNINLSGVTLSNDALLDFVSQALLEHEVAAHQICFEITETAAIRNLTKTEAFIRELKAAGCKFALDDFGTGLSSLNYLKRLPVNYLKIDRTFIRDIHYDAGSRAMVAAVHHMAKALGIETVAEGVEHRSTLHILEDLRIDFVQGFEVGVPKPLAHFGEPC